MLIKLKQWFANHNKLSHSIMGFIVTCGLVYGSDQTVRDSINGVLIKLATLHPEIIAVFVPLIVGYLKYSGGHSTQGQAVQVIEAVAATSLQQVQTAVAEANKITPADAPAVSVLPIEPYVNEPTAKQPTLRSETPGIAKEKLNP